MLKNNMFSKNKPYPILALLAAMVSIQAGAALAKHLFQAVGPQGITSLRLLFATIILVSIWRPWKKLPPREQWPTIIYYGISLGSMNLLFYLSIARIPLGIAIAIEFTGPLAIALIGSRRLYDIIWLISAATGIALLLPISVFSEKLDMLGILYSFAAAACWALYIIFGQKAGNAAHGGTVTALGMIIATLLVFPIGVAQAGLKIFDWSILPYGIAVAILSSAIPYPLEMVGLRNLPTRTFSILMSMEPVIGTLSGIIFLGEHLGLIQCVAIGLVIIASIGSTWSAQTAETAPEMTP